MSGYKAMYLKKQQKSKYSLCKHQFRGKLKIKNQSISPKRLVGIESNISHHALQNFLDFKPLSELLKNFFCITLERRWRVLWQSDKKKTKYKITAFTYFLKNWHHGISAALIGWMIRKYFQVYCSYIFRCVRNWLLGIGEELKQFWGTVV